MGEKTREREREQKEERERVEVGGERQNGKKRIGKREKAKKQNNVER
jgi:hypothetical protein